MKEYKITYIIIYCLIILLIITKGFTIGIDTSGHNNPLFYCIQPGHTEILDINAIIAFNIIIVSAVLTFSKDNEIELKGLILLGIIILVLFIPIKCHYGIKTEYDNVYTLIINKLMINNNILLK